MWDKLLKKKCCFTITSCKNIANLTMEFTTILLSNDKSSFCLFLFKSDDAIIMFSLILVPEGHPKVTRNKTAVANSNNLQDQSIVFTIPAGYGLGWTWFALFNPAG